MQGKKIVVPLDGSPLAETALPLAIKLAKFTGAQLLLLRVTVLPEELEEAFTRENPDQLMPLHYLEKVRADLTDPAKYPGLEADRVEVIVGRGKFAYEIPEIAQLEGGSLIVMTTHGLGGFTRLLLGSATQQVLRNSKLPVIVLRPKVVEAEKTDEAAEPLSFGQRQLTIAVPLDGEPVSEAALEPACYLAEKLNAEVRLLRVVKPVQPILLDEPVVQILYSRADQSDDLRYRRDDAARYLAQLKAKLAAHWKDLAFETEVLIGSPADCLVEWANRLQPFLVSMATHARGGVGQILLGSVADDVLREGNCPVMLVHIEKGYQGWRPNELAVEALI